MIDKLTEAQEELLKRRVQDGLDIGLSTVTHKPEAEEVITEFYKLLGLKKPEFLWCQSPKGIMDRYEKETGKEWDKTFYLWGSVDYYWVAFYKFCEEIGVKYDKKDSELLELWDKLSRASFWWYPFENACFVSEKPVEIHMVNGRLHNENGPAVKFSDGFETYSLNGIRVPEWVVNTPAKEIPMNRVISEKNVEIRQELIRKIGGQRVVEELQLEVVEHMTGEELYNKYPVGKYYDQGDALFVPDDEDDKDITILGIGLDKCEPATQIRMRQGVFYTLYSGRIDGMPTKILRMGNPSMYGEEHFEFVFKTCTNIIQSIGFRNQFVLTSKGRDWRNEEDILLPYILS